MQNVYANANENANSNARESANATAGSDVDSDVMQCNEMRYHECHAMPCHTMLYARPSDMT